jgi:hypothetical protein
MGPCLESALMPPLREPHKLTAEGLEVALAEEFRAALAEEFDSQPAMEQMLAILKRSPDEFARWLPSTRRDLALYVFRRRAAGQDPDQPTQGA